MMEGAILFTSRQPGGLTLWRKCRQVPLCLHGHALGRALSPTSRRASAASSGCRSGPLVFLGEVKSLLSEGRAQIGRAPASRPVDMARAIARLGVARGITQFQRFAYLERNGRRTSQSPRPHPGCRRPNSRLIDDLAPWLDDCTASCATRPRADWCKPNGSSRMRSSAL